MAPQLAPWTEAMLDLLADGQWHHREDLVTAAMRAVPPGRAMQERTRHLRSATPRPVSEHSAITAGARMLATEALRGLRARGRVELDGDHYYRALDGGEA